MSETKSVANRCGYAVGLVLALVISASLVAVVAAACWLGVSWAWGVVA